MSSTPQRSSRSGRQSLFYRDLASPVSARRPGRFSAAASSPLGLSSDPPPPPVFTLDDRADLSPEPELPPPASPTPSPRSPTPARGLSSPSSSFKIRGERGGSSVVNGGDQVVETASWWSPARGRDSWERAKGSPVGGVVQYGALLALPPPREAVGMELERSSLTPTGGEVDGEDWVTVFGFSPSDTNLIIREFEKCGVILKHVPGPRGSNWIHILYQNKYDAQKALRKSGTQISSVLIIGAKPIDPMHRQYLDEKLDGSNQRGFKVPFLPKALESLPGASQQPCYLQCSRATTGRRSTGAIATPSRSVVSKVMDLMFGI